MVTGIAFRRVPQGERENRDFDQIVVFNRKRQLDLKFYELDKLGLVTDSMI